MTRKQRTDEWEMLFSKTHRVDTMFNHRAFLKIPFVIVLSTGILGCHGTIDPEGVCPPYLDHCTHDDFDGDGVQNGNDDFPTDPACSKRNTQNCSSCGNGCPKDWLCNKSGVCFNPCKGIRCGPNEHGGSCGKCQGLKGEACFTDGTCSSPYQCYTCDVCKVIDCHPGTNVTLVGVPASCVEKRCYGQAYDHVIVDNKTKLMWEHYKKKEGSWQSGKTYCANLSLAGFQDWRMPNISEVRSLVYDCPTIEKDNKCDIKIGGSCGVTEKCLPCGITTTCLGKSCDTGNCAKYPHSSTNNGCDWMKGLVGSVYHVWSSSSVSESSTEAWYINFHLCNLKRETKSSSKQIFCVRGP